MFIKKNPFILLSSVGLIFFGLNQFFEFINFENQKNNALILMILSILNFVYLIKMMQKANNTK
jgi:hypothetical protein